jgi:TonB family protein
MSRDTRFWTNVALVTVAHLAVVLALARGSRDEPQANLQSVVWMSADAAAATEPKHTPAPTPASTVAPAEKPVESASQTPFKSEIQMPSPTPTPTAAPRPSPISSPTPKSSAKPSPSPKATPKKSVEPKATPRASAKPTAEKKTTETKKESITSSDQNAEKKESASKGSGNAASQPSELAWYGTMLHDRFYKAWDQPKSSVPTGAKMSTIVRIRIEKDGKVSKFAIVKPSGNVVVDESVAAIAQRVTHVDPLPEGLTTKAFYEVKIDFELNAGK